jgi:hypothetical protein
VRVDDPQLSPEANRHLTEELQETLGTDAAEVPVDRPHPSRGEIPNQSGFAAAFGERRAERRLDADLRPVAPGAGRGARPTRSSG